MISKNKSTGSAHVIIIVCLVVALLGTLGMVFYQNFIQKKSTNTTTQISQTASTSSSGTTVSLGQFTSHKYLIRFTYPIAWSVNELVREDQSDWYSSVVTIKDDKGVTVAQLGTGGQFGGACDPAAPSVTATTLSDTALSIKGLSTAHYGYTIVQGEDSKFYTYYGLNKGDLPKGTQSVQCAGMSIGYHYIVNAIDSPVGAVTFGSWNAGSDFDRTPFTTFDEAKSYTSSTEMKQIEQMISSLSVGV